MARETSHHAVGRREILSLVAVAAVLVMGSLDTVAVNVALPSLEGDLALAPAEGAAVVSAYLVGLVGVVLVAGRLADQFGRRKAMVGGTIAFTAASLLCGFAPGIWTLIAGRALQGMAAAFMLAPGRAIIVSVFPREWWGRALGIGASVSSAAVIVGPVLAGALVDAGSWRGVFFINVPLAVVALTLVLLTVEESRDPRAGRHFDVPGAVTSIVGLALLVTGLTALEGRIGEVVSPGPTIAAGAALLVAFVLIERRSREPLLELSLLRRPGYSLAGLLKMISSLAMLGLLVVVVLFEQDALGYSALAAGASIVPLMGLGIVVGPVAGVLIDRWGALPIVFAGLASFLAGFGLLVALDTDVVYVYLLGAFVVVGLGNQLTANSTNVMAMATVGRDRAGQASGVLTFCRRTGGLLGVVMATLVFSAVARGAIEHRLDDPGVRIGPAQRAVLLHDLERRAPRALFASAHHGEAARIGREASAEGLRAVVLVLFGLIVVATLVAITLGRRERTATEARPSPVAQQ